MTLSSETRSVTYNCNGVLTDFAYSYPFFNSSDLVVTLIDTSTTPDTETVLTETTNYSVATTANSFRGGGTVTTVATYSGIYQLRIERVVDLTQTVDFDRYDAFDSQSNEDALDKNMMAIQQLSDKSVLLGQEGNQGDIIYHNGTDWTRLAHGTSGQYLKTNGTGANPEWSTAATGAGDMLQSQYDPAGRGEQVVTNPDNNMEAGTVSGGNGFYLSSTGNHTLTNYGFAQGTTGDTFLNSPSGAVISARINNVTKFGVATDACNFTVPVKINTTDTGFNANADNLIVGEGGAFNDGMTIYTGSGGTGCIYWADTGSNKQGYIEYVHSTDNMNIGTDNTIAIGIDSSQNLTIAQDIYTVVATDYLGTSTVSGWVTPAGSIYYRKLGKEVTIWFDITGTSNSTTITFTLPYANNSNVACSAVTGFAQNSGTALTTPGRINLPTNNSTVTIYKDCASGAWTASGTKRVIGTFKYHTD